MKKLLIVGLLSIAVSGCFAGQEIFKTIPFYNVPLQWGDEVWGMSSGVDGQTIVCTVNPLKDNYSPIYGNIHTWGMKYDANSSPIGEFKTGDRILKTFIFYNVHEITGGYPGAISFKNVYDFYKTGFTVSCVYQ